MPNKPSRALLFSLFAFLCLAGMAEGGQVSVISRQAWKAKAPTLQMDTQVPKHILIHHTGSVAHPGLSVGEKMRRLQHFSQTRQKLADGRIKEAWADVPYHYYIGVDGTIAEGREITAVGDTNTSYDPAGYIQIVVEGNFETEIPSKEELASLVALLQSLMKKFGMAQDDISFHQTVAQTACPGRHLIDLLPDIKAQLP